MHQDYSLKDPKREPRLFITRIGIAAALVMLMSGGLVWRYYHLQVMRHADFVTESDRNRVQVRPVPPTRGLIFDRNGVLLADNRPSFTLKVVKENAGDLERLFTELGKLIELSEEDIARFRQQLKRRQRPYEPVPLKFNLTEKESARLAVNEYRLPGIDVTAELVRHYPLGPELSHVLGYVGRINDRELRVLDSVRYSGTLVIGKTGIEKYYEDRLLGDVGHENVETNSRGRVMRVLDRTDPRGGKDLHLHLDSRLQHIAYEALGNERGAVVAVDVHSGGVLAMASTPGFDPNPFVTGIGYADYQALLNSPDRPLFDRTLFGQYPPGSAIKPIIGLAALEYNIVDRSTTFSDPGFFRLPGDKRKYRDWKKYGHGPAVDLRMAIEQSCDVFFYNTGHKLGIDKMSSFGAPFGLGHPTGIDIPGERSGVWPSRDWKRGARGESWYPGDTINTSIGQGFVLVTPLQLAVATSRLATRGEIHTPRLVRQSRESSRAPASHIQVRSANWDYLLGAMEDVVHGLRGTAHGISRGLAYRMGGKTGTAQVVGIKQDEKYDAKTMAKLHLDHALFIAFAPADDPEIALSVVVENGEHGATTAAPIAREVIDAFMAYYPNGLASASASPEAAL